MKPSSYRRPSAGQFSLAFVFLALLCALATANASVAAPGPEACEPDPADIAAERCRDDLAHFLLHAEVVASQTLKTGITRSQRLTLRLAGVERRAIFKTIHRRSGVSRSSRHRRTAFVADSYRNEVAAYRIARLLGLNVVPVTVIREIQGEKGSLQLWVENAVSLYNFSEDNYPEPAVAQLRRPGSLLQVFDTLICNDDRNHTNILYVAELGNLWWIDHSRAFGTLLSPPSHVKRSSRLLTRDASNRLLSLSVESLQREVTGLLSASQIRAVIARRDRILKFWPTQTTDQ